jgi:gas vesicle protein
MVGLVSLIPSVINLLTSSDKKEGVKELVKEVATKIGSEPSQEKIIEHLEKNPQDATKLKEIELRAKELLNQDRKDARDMNVRLQEYGSWLVKNTASILAIGVVSLCFALFYMVLFGRLSLGEANTGMLIGGAIGFVTQVLSFYFGSSQDKGIDK